MKREKTVIDVEVSEEKQKEIVSSLLREHTNVGMKFERERTRQEEMVRLFNFRGFSRTVEIKLRFHFCISLAYCEHCLSPTLQRYYLYSSFQKKNVTAAARNEDYSAAT